MQMINSSIGRWHCVLHRNSQKNTVEELNEAMIKYLASVVLFVIALVAPRVCAAQALPFPTVLVDHTGSISYPSSTFVGITIPGTQEASWTAPPNTAAAYLGPLESQLTCPPKMLIHIHGWRNDLASAQENLDDIAESAEAAGFSGHVVGFAWDSTTPVPRCQGSCRMCLGPRSPMPCGRLLPPTLAPCAFRYAPPFARYRMFFFRIVGLFKMFRVGAQIQASPHSDSMVPWVAPRTWGMRNASWITPSCADTIQPDPFVAAFLLDLVVFLQYFFCDTVVPPWISGL